MGGDGNLKADLLKLFIGVDALTSRHHANPGITAYSYGTTPDEKGPPWSEDLLYIV